ncbi:alpha/beta hydrolase [Rhodanobacter sp. DHB23]|uniref:alpha/beta hydrolase n=1 Tax=Rhodanobacter sp. DHB23 TaxID=2775923 RepID=UPI00177E7CB0|nr:alpha/beta hydrolase [Rhodanobacter sp. DHB23]MBD8874302.1 alpha/beta hydrolase [Rhodanobacter sp. DHB23]
MKTWPVFFGLLLACAGTHAAEAAWQPSAGHVQLSLWPGTPPDMKAMPGPEYAALRKEHLIAGKPWLEVANVSQPTMTVYSPRGKNTGAAVVVFPGGGFEVLAMDLEGTEICDWLTSRGITCVLLKYRVPGAPYDWHCKCRPDDYEVPTMALEDAQRAMGLVRLHAKEWSIDPHKLGVVGFSAGGFLVAEISTHFGKRLYKPVDAADKESARPDFAMAIYPGHLALDDGKLNPNVPVTRDTPPTFIVQAEDDDVDGVQQALTYFAALKAADVPTEMHIYAQGGHAFGVRHTDKPITAWTNLADAWMRTIGVLPR